MPTPKKQAPKKQKNEVLVNIVLDKSGSMGSTKDATISAINEYVKTLADDKDADYKVAITMFDTEVFVGKRKDAGSLTQLDRTNYRPDGMTALYDAVCKTIVDTRKGTTKSDKILTIIMTDGDENSSKEYTQDQLKALIAECEKEGNWTFVFLGANQDAWSNAQKYGLSRSSSNVANYKSSGIGASMASVAKATRTYGASSVMSSASFFSAKEKKDIEDAK